SRLTRMSTSAIVNRRSTSRGVSRKTCTAVPSDAATLRRPQCPVRMDGMGQTGLGPWRDGLAAQGRGHQCVLCDLIGARANDWGIRVFTGQEVEAYLARSGSVPGYTVAIWNGRHVSEPTQLRDAEAIGFWVETLRVGRAVEQDFEHAKMNYQTLGNSVPHLH